MFFFCNPPWIKEKTIIGGYNMVDQFMVIFNTYLKKLQPSKVYFAVDGWPEWRKELYPEYKATRGKEKTPEIEAFYRNKKAVKKLLEYLPVGIAYHEKLEADDIAYVICKYYTDKDVDVIALSTDKDWLQLMKHFSNVMVYNQLKKSFVDKLDYDIVKMKCLTGDSSDNINGFKRIGEATAKKIMETKETFFKWYNELSEEGQQLYKRNLKLMSFKKIPENYIEEAMDSITKIEFKSKINWEEIEKYYESLNLDKQKLKNYIIEDLCRI